MTETAVSPPPQAVPNVAIRAKPHSPKRLSRKVLLAATIVAGAVIAFALVNGLSERPDRARAAQHERSRMRPLIKPIVHRSM